MNHKQLITLSSKLSDTITFSRITDEDESHLLRNAAITGGVGAAGYGGLSAYRGLKTMRDVGTGNGMRPESLSHLWQATKIGHARNMSDITGGYNQAAGAVKGGYNQAADAAGEAASGIGSRASEAYGAAKGYVGRGYDAAKGYASRGYNAAKGYGQQAAGYAKRAGAYAGNIGAEVRGAGLGAFKNVAGVKGLLAKLRGVKFASIDRLVLLNSGLSDVIEFKNDDESRAGNFFRGGLKGTAIGAGVGAAYGGVNGLMHTNKRLRQAYFLNKPLYAQAVGKNAGAEVAQMRKAVAGGLKIMRSTPKRAAIGAAIMGIPGALAGGAIGSAVGLLRKPKTNGQQ